MYKEKMDVIKEMQGEDVSKVDLSQVFYGTVSHLKLHKIDSIPKEGVIITRQTKNVALVSIPLRKIIFSAHGGIGTDLIYRYKKGIPYQYVIRDESCVIEDFENNMLVIDRVQECSTLLRYLGISDDLTKKDLKNMKKILLKECKKTFSTIVVPEHKIMISSFNELISKDDLTTINSEANQLAMFKLCKIDSNPRPKRLEKVFIENQLN